MKRTLSAGAAVLVVLGCPSFAHRLDEYLQATIISVEEKQVQLSMRLIPGVAVSSVVLSDIDANRDGAISEAEGQAYSQRVLHELSLSLDGHRLSPRLVSASFPRIEDIKEGVGEIRMEFTAALPGGNTNRKLTFENHHDAPISAYLVNCLAPADARIRVAAQKRNRSQSFYELDYVLSGAPASDRLSEWASRLRTAGGNLGGIGNMFRLGLRHIAEGTDHLLFLLVLLVPAPLLSAGSRWAGSAGRRHSFKCVLKVVTAFTLGHSITLALAALGFVALPSRPIEVLIAVSIFVSAVHAIRPLFPGREPAIAASFGLVHGLAFAATLSQLGLQPWERLANILAFNAGIETMQLVVVAAIMPSLLLLSGTRVYPWFRVGGAGFAAIASAGWIGERLLNVGGPVDFMVEAVAHRGVWLAAGLLAASTICWRLEKNAGGATELRNGLSVNLLPENSE
jgi:HupE / UreJ protein